MKKKEEGVIIIKIDTGDDMEDVVKHLMDKEDNDVEHFKALASLLDALTEAIRSGDVASKFDFEGEKEEEPKDSESTPEEDKDFVLEEEDSEQEKHKKHVHELLEKLTKKPREHGRHRCSCHDECSSPAASEKNNGASIRETVDVLAECFSRKLSPALLAVYDDVLQEVRPDALQAAARRFMADPDGAMPTPGQLLRASMRCKQEDCAGRRSVAGGYRRRGDRSVAGDLMASHIEEMTK